MTSGQAASEAASADVCIIEYLAAGDLPKVCDDVLEAAVRVGVELYQHAGRLVKVVRPESARRPCKHFKTESRAPFIVAHDEASLVDALTRDIEFYRPNRKGQLVRCDCPPVVARTILARKDWPSVPHLKAVVEHPLVLPDGELLIEAGYYAGVEILLSAGPHEFIAVDASISRTECFAALAEIEVLLEGFAFEAEIDFSVTLAFLMTFFARALLPTAPIFAWSAHAPGSGKSTLARLGSVVATGREPAMLVDPGDDAELGKALFAALLEGAEHIPVDNLVGSLDGPLWAVLTTSPVYRARVLGQSATVAVPTSAVISVNGNNLQVIGDLTRRVLIAALDPQCERPAERQFEFDPIHLATEQRGKFVHALVTIMCGYLRSGERVSVRPFGSFELWSRMVREPLVWLNLPDPVDSIRFLEDADPEREALRVMLDVVASIFSEREFKAADLVSLTKRSSRQAEFGDSAGPAVSDGDQHRLAEALRAVCERNGELSVKALGRWLARMAGRIEGGRRFEKVRQHKDFAGWRVDLGAAK